MRARVYLATLISDSAARWKKSKSLSNREVEEGGGGCIVRPAATRFAVCIRYKGEFLNFPGAVTSNRVVIARLAGKY